MTDRKTTELGPPKRRSMEELEIAAIATLARANQPVRCGWIGNGMFPGRHRGSAPYARLAGKVIRRLERKGLATFESRGRWGSWGWVLTAKGKRIAMRADQASDDTSSTQ